jgi:hypothetical protein
MPRLDLWLQSVVDTALQIVRAGEQSHLPGGTTSKLWTLARLESLYELAFLRSFAAWEACLEGAFFRSLCGYASRAGQETLVRGRYYRNIGDAEAAFYTPKRPYMLWHKPSAVITRCTTHIRSRAPGCPGVQETILSSSSTYLDHLASIRHRIVHDQADAKRQFDIATTFFAGRIYPASRPGRFLRDTATAHSSQNWLGATTRGLIQLAAQLV